MVWEESPNISKKAKIPHASKKFIWKKKKEEKENRKRRKQKEKEGKKERKEKKSLCGLIQFWVKNKLSPYLNQSI